MQIERDTAPVLAWKKARGRPGPASGALVRRFTHRDPTIPGVKVRITILAPAEFAALGQPFGSAVHARRPGAGKITVRNTDQGSSPEEEVPDPGSHHELPPRKEDE